MPLFESATMTLWVDGTRISTLKDVTITSSSGKIKVETLEGFVGASVGSGSVQISGTAVVPIGGLTEFDFFNESTQQAGFHDCMVTMGAKTYKGNGYFDNAALTRSVGAQTEVNFTFEGESVKAE